MPKQPAKDTDRKADSKDEAVNPNPTADELDAIGAKWVEKADADA